MTSTMFWIAAAAVVVLFAAWRLRRANHTLNTILREERDHTDLEPAPGVYDTADEPVSHKPGRHRKRH
jgi:hypothetical protein